MQGAAHTHPPHTPAHLHLCVYLYEVVGTSQNDLTAKCPHFAPKICVPVPTIYTRAPIRTHSCKYTQSPVRMMLKDLGHLLFYTSHLNSLPKCAFPLVIFCLSCATVGALKLLLLARPRSRCKFSALSSSGAEEGQRCLGELRANALKAQQKQMSHYLLLLFLHFFHNIALRC